VKSLVMPTLRPTSPKVIVIPSSEVPATIGQLVKTQMTRDEIATRHSSLITT
jgi:hypothetical protein